MSHNQSSINRIRNVPRIISGICMICITLALLSNILFRNLNIGFVGLQELAQLLTVWLTFILLGDIELEDEHIRVSFFVDSLPRKFKNAIRVAILFVNISVSVIITYSALLGVQQLMNVTSPSLNISQSAWQMAAFVGMGIISIIYFYEIGLIFVNMVGIID